MSVRKPREPVSARLHQQYEREHAGWVDFLAEMEPYAAANPDDTWAQGQVKYAKKRLLVLSRIIGLAVNRQERPAQ